MSVTHKTRKFSDETRDRISTALKGRVMSSEWRAKISAAKKGKPVSPECLAASVAATKGKPGKKHSEETKRKLSLINTGKIISPETKIKISLALKDRQHSPEHNAKVAQGLVGRELSPESRAQISQSLKGKYCGEKNPNYGKDLGEEHRRKTGEASKARWAIPEFRDEVVRKIRKGRGHKQTEPERILEQILNEHFPNEYKYVGSGTDVVIAGCNPDFININGKKKIIEVFGDFYHSIKITGRTLNAEEQSKIDGYKSYGFGCLILWEHEVKKHHDEVIAKIKAFNADRSMQLHLKI